MIDWFSALNCQVWNLQHFIDNQNFKLVKSPVMLRIVHVNPVGCGLELSRKHGCRHVWREPTAEIFSNSWFSTKEMSRTIQRKRLGTLSFIPQSDLQIGVEVFRNGVKIYSRSLEPDDVSAVGSVWASSAGEQQMPIFFFPSACIQQNICLAVRIFS